MNRCGWLQSIGWLGLIAAAIGGIMIGLGADRQEWEPAVLGVAWFAIGATLAWRHL